MRRLPLLVDFSQYLKFVSFYSKKRMIQAFRRFEKAKGFLVDWLVTKRGVYVRPFLHSSMSGLFLIGLMLAPLIKGALPESDYFDGRDIMVLGVTDVDEATTTQISVKPRDTVVTYIIKPGDTLSSVALKFGVSEDTIRWQNDLKDKNPILKPDDKLEIPPVTGLTHKVKRGETVYSVAKKYSVDPQAIVNWPFQTYTNDETFELAVGQLLIVPDGVPPKELPVAKDYLAERRKTVGEVAGSGQFAWPARGYITQSPIWYHMALDIANSDAPEVASADSGTVIYSGCSGPYGCHIIVDHANGFETLYAHLSKLYVSQGEVVSRGSSVGKMGSTGRSTGVHLHFEIKKNGAAQNPLNYLK